MGLSRWPYIKAGSNGSSYSWERSTKRDIAWFMLIRMTYESGDRLINIDHYSKTSQLGAEVIDYLFLCENDKKDLFSRFMIGRISQNQTKKCICMRRGYHGFYKRFEILWLCITSWSCKIGFVPIAFRLQAESFENHINVWFQYDQHITYTYQYIIEIREILLLDRLPTKANALCLREIDGTP